jgi:integrase
MARLILNREGVDLVMRELGRDIIMIGRAPLNQIVIDHPTVSAQHAVLLRTGRILGVHPFARYLRAVFNFGIRRGWCLENPVKRIEMHSLKMRKEILTNAQVADLLKAVCDTDLELLPYHVLCIFAGVRPKEAERLSWNNLNMTERFSEVPEEKLKSAMRRIVEMEPLLFRWLDYYIRAGVESKAT